MKRFSIQFPLLPEQDDSPWGSTIAFTQMKTSYANGAWAMLKAMANKDKRYRFVEVTPTNEVIRLVDTCGKNVVTLQ